MPMADKFRSDSVIQGEFVISTVIHEVMVNKRSHTKRNDTNTEEFVISTGSYRLYF